MLAKIITLLTCVQDVANDTYNPDTYFNETDRSNAGMLISTYVLGSLFAKGYDNNSQLNFEIYYQANQGYQVWIWKFDADKDTTKNDFNTAYYNTHLVTDFFRKVLA